MSATVPVSHTVRYKYRLHALLVDKFGKIRTAAAKSMAEQAGVSFSLLKQDCSRSMLQPGIPKSRLEKYAQYLGVDVSELKTSAL